jgi:hypothetical protein
VSILATANRPRTSRETLTLWKIFQWLSQWRRRIRLGEARHKHPPQAFDQRSLRGVGDVGLILVKVKAQIFP